MDDVGFEPILKETNRSAPPAALLAMADYLSKGYSVVLIWI